MKINKLFMLGLAGLAFTACSSDEDVTTQSTFPAGNGAVCVKIVNPSTTRSLTTPTSGANGSKIDINGTLKVTLSYKDKEDQEQTQTLEIAAADLNNDTQLKFWNIYKPEKLTVSINDGKASYSDVSIVDMQDAPAGIAAYGETSTFNITAETGSPVIANDKKTEQGAEEGDENKTYQMYKASVTMAIPVARLEVSGITHVTHAGEPDDVCEYTTLTIAGAYLDNLCPNGGTYSAGTYSAATNVTDYCWLEGQTPSLGTGATAILKDAISGGANERSFLTGTWPANGQAFAYNFYASGTNPIFKLYFDTSEASSAEKPRPAPRYAMVSKYVDGDGGEVTFENGKIYRITNVELADKNIIGDEEGNILYGVTVTVTEAQWSIVDISADWVTQ